MRYFTLVISLALFLGLTGCASMFGSNDRSIHVNSRPQGADVYVNNNLVGVTPTMITVPSTWSSTLVTFKKRGFQPQYAQVNTQFQPIGLLNILFWPGFIIDAAAGNMMKVSPDSKAVNAMLIRSDA